jgi:gluconate 2-dehydrogenase gamma chain
MSTLQGPKLGRRALLKGASMYGGGLLMALNLERPLALAAMAKAEPVVFSEDQWQTVAAMSARIIPTDHQGGATEANCVNFIDKALANEDAAATPDFKLGLAALHHLCMTEHQVGFASLDVANQDELLLDLQAGKAQPWPATGPTAADFFETVRLLTIMGFMADPKYGGNAGMTGWKVARYPGPRHHQGGYTPAQMIGDEKIITAWGDEM